MSRLLTRAPMHLSVVIAAAVMLVSCSPSPSGSLVVAEPDPTGTTQPTPEGWTPPTAGAQEPETDTSTTLPSTPTTTVDETPTTTVAPPTTTTPPVPTSYVAKGERLGVGSCPLFPRDNAMHANIRNLPVREGSDRIIAAGGGKGEKIRPSLGSAIWEGSRPGIPVNITDSRVVRTVDVIGGLYKNKSDLNGHPIPASPRIEGFPGMAWDRHLLIVDEATCVSSEMWYVTPPWLSFLGRWHAETAVKIDLTNNEFRAGGTANAAGLSMLAGMIRYDEVASGDINHAVTVALPKIRKSDPFWPANKTDGRSDDPDAPPMGTWFRLKDSADLSNLGPQAKVIARAFKDHGAVLGDTNHGGLQLGGESDHRWDDSDLNTLRKLTLDDFEVIDPTPMMISEKNLQIR